MCQRLVGGGRQRRVDLVQDSCAGEMDVSGLLFLATLILTFTAAREYIMT